MEGTLYASAQPGRYALNSSDGPQLANGQAVELLLGGQWIAGYIAYSEGITDTARSSSGQTLEQTRGAYVLSRDNPNDEVTEASEESFPSSDPPAWTGSPEGAQRIQHGNQVVNGYYFVARSDHSICGLCIGMRVQVREG